MSDTLNEISDRMSEQLIKGLNPSMILCDEHTLRELKELIRFSEDKEREITWKDLIGGYVMGLKINHDRYQEGFSILEDEVSLNNQRKVNLYMKKRFGVDWRPK